ncbi:hypothetical protein V2G26_008211 [Clonostachys chloroleuca]
MQVYTHIFLQATYHIGGVEFYELVFQSSIPLLRSSSVATTPQATSSHATSPHIAVSSIGEEHLHLTKIQASSTKHLQSILHAARPLT